MSEPRAAADALAAGVRGFIEVLPYLAPEALELHVRARLAKPLAAYEQATTERATT